MECLSLRIAARRLICHLFLRLLAENAGDDRGHVSPFGGFGLELTRAGSGERVKAGAAIVLRSPHAPLIQPGAQDDRWRCRRSLRISSARRRSAGCAAGCRNHVVNREDRLGITSQVCPAGVQPFRHWSRALSYLGKDVRALSFPSRKDCHP